MSQLASSTRPGALSSGFPALVVTQFLGALNDNLFKISISLFAATVAVTGGGAGTNLAIAGALFVLPYLLFSGYAGFLSDAYSKRQIMIRLKVAEIAIMSLGMYALWTGRLELMFAVLFLMATQSAFFSPAKYGILPDMFPPHELARANGFMEMATFLAIIVGTVLGGILFDIWEHRLALVGLMAILIATSGTVTSLFIAASEAPRTQDSFSIYPWLEIQRGLLTIAHDRALRLVVIGISVFWFLGALVQLNVILLGTEIMEIGKTQIGLLQAAMGFGIGVGCLAAGRLFGRQIGMMLVPIGSLGVGVSGLLVFSATSTFLATCGALVAIGFFGGLFVIPMNTILQHQAGPHLRGRIIATNNFVNMIGVLLASLALWLLRSVLDIQADTIFLFVLIIAVMATILVGIPVARLKIPELLS